MLFLSLISLAYSQTTYIMFNVSDTNMYVLDYGQTCTYDTTSVAINNKKIQQSNWYLQYDIATTTNQIPENFVSLNQIDSYTKLNISNQFAQSQIMIYNIVNVYTNMLETRWTDCLRSAGLISPTNIITLYNTSSPQNMTYLIMLANNPATIDQYKAFSSEFRVVVDTLKDLGVDIGDLAK